MRRTRIESFKTWRGGFTYLIIRKGLEYIPYITLKSNAAYSIWNGIYIRCYIDNNGSSMCDLWRYNKDSFAEWWSSEYYECDGE